VAESVPVTEQGYANGQSWWSAFLSEDTPELVWPKSIDVYDRMRRQDAQVISVLRAVTLPIRRTTWRVDQAGASPEVAAFVADELGLPLAGQPARTPPPRTRDRFSWAEHLRLALLMLVFGHSFFEQVYRPDPAQDRYHLRKLAWRPPKTLDRIEVAADGGLVGIHQAGMKDQDLIEVSRLVAYVNDREGGNWLGQSLLRPAYKNWLLKDPALRTWALTIERNGMGVPLFQGPPVPDGMDGPDEIEAWETKQLAAGLKLATNVRGGKNAGGAMPHGATLALQGVTGKLPDSDPFIRYQDEQIARAVLANFLNLGGDNSTGSYALGDTFADFFVQSLQTTGEQTADTATQHVVEDLVDVNYGPNEPAPRITFDEIGASHAINGDTARALVDARVLSPDETLEQHIRTMYRLPAADLLTRRQKTTTTEEAA